MILKRELAEFATVEILHPAQIRTISKNVNSIVSPSGNFLVAISFSDFIGDDNCGVCVVSDGGYLFIWEYFDEEHEDLNITFARSQRANEQLFHEMYIRTTSILNKLDIDYK